MLGSSCNTTSDPCTMSQPCLNLATCHPNSSLPNGYSCQCYQGYSGLNCEVDTQICRPQYGCFYGGACTSTNTTSNVTQCTCPSGKNGNHCEYEIDACGNITCENRAQCVSAFGNWSCLCVDYELYSGIYCETKSDKLKTKEIVSRSFASIAIGSIGTVLSFVIIMDLLKYCFRIDPIMDERRFMKEQEEIHRKEKQKLKRERENRILNPQQRASAVRFQYIHA